MACVNKLKLLKNEISRLFRAGLDEKDVFNQLRSDEKFADATREHVQSFYNRLQDESNAKVENEQQIAINDQEIAELQRQIDEHERLVPENEQAIAEHQQQLAEFEQELAAKQQLKFDLAFAKHEQNSSKFLMYEAVSSRSFLPRRFWQQRFFIEVEDEETDRNTSTIKVLDLLQGETKIFTVGKVSSVDEIYLLKFPHVLLLEYHFSNRVSYLHLTEFDFESNSLLVVQTLPFTDDCNILVNSSDASKFLLSEENAVKECKLVGGKVQIGKSLALDTFSEFDCVSYFDDYFCQLRYVIDRNDQSNSSSLTQVKMIICNLEQNERSIHDLRSTHVKWPRNEHLFTWMRDTVFFTVQFPFTEKYGVIYTNPQMRSWQLVEFATDIKNYCVQSFADGALMICGREDNENEEQCKSKFYKLQICKPDLLRNMAWNAIVKLLKEAEIEKPYEQAREVLPLNSEIHTFMLTEN